jgi:hypothetical protein
VSGPKKKPRTLVQLSDIGSQQMGSALLTYAKKNSLGHYFMCDQVDPNGPYFFMSVETGIDGEDGPNLEVSVPHAYIRYFMKAESETHIGFAR